MSAVTHGHAALNMCESFQQDARKITAAPRAHQCACTCSSTSPSKSYELLQSRDKGCTAGPRAISIHPLASGTETAQGIQMMMSSAYRPVYTGFKRRSH